MKGSIIIVLFFAAGIFSGLFSLLPGSLTETDLSSWALYLLMFLVGIGIGGDPAVWKTMKNLNFAILLVPLAVITGSLGGAVVISFFFDSIDVCQAMAVGAGFGYYSLSSIYITELSGETLGVVALLSNIMREIITLLLAPLMAISFGKLAPIASGGATAMDTTLPIIVRSSGKQFALIAVFSGVVLTVLVPVLISLILKFC